MLGLLVSFIYYIRIKLLSIRYNTKVEFIKVNPTKIDGKYYIPQTFNKLKYLFINGKDGKIYLIKGSYNRGFVVK